PLPAPPSAPRRRPGAAAPPVWILPFLEVEVEPRPEPELSLQAWARRPPSAAEVAAPVAVAAAGQTRTWPIRRMAAAIPPCRRAQCPAPRSRATRPPASARRPPPSARRRRSGHRQLGNGPH